MATTLSVNAANLNLGWDYENTGFPGNAKDVNQISYAGPSLTSGTGVGNANIKYSAQITLAASATTTFNLQSLTDQFGNALNFVRIKELSIENSSVSSASSINVGSATTLTWSSMMTGTQTVRNGSIYFNGVASDATGYVVNSGNALELTNNDSSNGATVKISIIGCNS